MNFQGFIDSLSFMGIGMASIIIVIGVLVISVLLLNLFTSNKVKISRKIIFVSALVVLLVGVSLLNGIRMNKAVSQYVEENKEKIVADFEKTLALPKSETEIVVQGRGFIITFIDERENIPEEDIEKRKTLRAWYELLLEGILAETKNEVNELQKIEFSICDKSGNTHVSVTADGK